MLPLFTRRVATSVRHSTATYARISSPSVSTLRFRTILDSGLYTSTVQSFANAHRNASTEVAAKSPKVSRKKDGDKLAPKQKAPQANLLPGGKLQKRKKKDAAVLSPKPEKGKKKVKEAKKPMIIKPPPRRFNGYAQFIREAKRPLQECAREWRSLSEEQKQEYDIRGKVEREKRREEFDEFIKSVTPLDVKRYNRHQRSKGRAAIHVKFNDRLSNRPLPAFIKFNQEFRTQPDQVGKSLMEISKAAGEAWHALTEEEKDKYKAVPGGPTGA